MKKVLLGSITLCFLLTGCDEKTSVATKENKTTPSNQETKADNKENKPENEIAKSNQETKTSEKEVGKIQGSQINPQVQSRYTSEMTSVEGHKYTMHIFANNEKHETQTDTWAGAEAGDEIYQGSYQIALQSKNSPLYLQEAQLGEFLFNGSQKSGYVSKGSPDFFLALQREASNISTGKAFYINKGKVIEVKILGADQGIGIIGHFKGLDKGKFMTATYNNSEGIWNFSTYQTDLETGNAKEIDSKMLPLEEGKGYLMKNFDMAF
ncbi:hypothetical protein CN677_11450 [Bacillus pseudomycoides]|uniref:hypothetical protein n=1 Tax=Bacillus pseudomycoides TaxID=64104 RepID=UPI000BF01601|nr:hypothetical protein [Bacillus pseudomycoides]PEJ36434.1 hypothetical protein CN677_11450 [Bacillus pseudomycoides]